MDEHLVGYVLNCLDDETRVAVAAYLRTHPEARRRLESLRRLLAPLAADGGVEAPSDLADRTLGRIAAQRSCDLPRAPRLVRSCPGDRSLWRCADALAAASLLLLVVGVSVLGLFKSRQTQALLGCQNNLREFHAALNDFSAHEGDFPNVMAQKERAVAGMVVPMLVQTGFLPGDANVRCPGDGGPAACPWTLEQLQTVPQEEFLEHAPHLSGSYAYGLGFRDTEGNYFGPTKPDGRLAAGLPIMADCPGPHADAGNSSNHGGSGQNVLFQDGHVTFLTTRVVGGDDFYLNKDRKVAAGTDPLDIVLGASDSKPKP